jgi:hypothetical protein
VEQEALLLGSQTPDQEEAVQSRVQDSAPSFLAAGPTASGVLALANDAVTNASVVHDPQDERFELAIQAFDELGYRLDHENLSQSLGASGGGAPLFAPAITLVFVPKWWDTRPENP